jgi:antitoxin HicB
MKTVQEYLALPYMMTVRWDEESSLFVARVKEIPSCSAHGETRAAALEMLEENLEDWITVCLEDGDAIPIPEDSGALPSGKWLQRVPRSLHKKLVEAADYEGVSLNQFVSTCLAEAIGEKRGLQQDQPAMKTTVSTLHYFQSKYAVADDIEKASLTERGYAAAPESIWFSPQGSPQFEEGFLDILQSSCAALPAVGTNSRENKKGDVKNNEKQAQKTTFHH